MYKVYLSDGYSTAELDVEDIDFQSQFAVADMANLNTRKDNIKTLNIKATKNNNKVFGFFFDFGNTSDSNILNNLYSNYNPIINCDVFIYENSQLIFKGTLRLNKTKLVNGNVMYECIITSTMLEFKVQTQDKLLTDLSFEDLKHRYNINSIVNSWSGSTEIVNGTGYTSTGFQLGKNYVYPRVDYGYYSGETATIINVRNYKPSIYVKEYFNRIFSEAGFTYSLIGDDLNSVFERLVVVNTEEGTTGIFSGITTTASKSSVLVVTEGNSNYTKANGYRIIPIQNIVYPPSNIIGPLVDLYNTKVWSQINASLIDTPSLKITRNFSADGLLQVSFQRLINLETVPVEFHVQLVKRTLEEENDYVANINEAGFDRYTLFDNRAGNWTVVSEQVVTLQPNDQQYGINIDVPIGVTNYIESDLLAVQIQMKNLSPLYANDNAGVYERPPVRAYFTLLGTTLKFPYQSLVKADVLPSTGTTAFDTIIPVAPQNIKQFDFIKGVMSLHNLYAYGTSNNPKHVFFEDYDSYYARCQPEYLKLVAVDWTNKIDYSKDVVVNSNISLPKSYLFTFKEDSDTLNKNYKEKFNQVYGNLNFTDSQGLIAQKKLEVPFSPLIVAQITGTDSKYPWLYQVENGKKKVAKSNIKLGFYNGLQDCTKYNIIAPYNEATYYSGLTQYPQVSNYLETGSTVVQDLHFGSPLEYYFTATNDYQYSLTSYSKYYINQTSELINRNVRYIDCYVLLNELDIANYISQDLKTPVYINTGNYNGSYFKVLNVVYEGNTVPSKVTLQRIVF